MTRFKVLCGAALLFALLIIGMTVIPSSAAQTLPKSPPHAPIAGVPQNQIPSAIGVPAIPIHTAKGATTNNASIPAFTTSDVAAFVNVNGFPSGPLVPGAHLKILTIQFVTAKQASALLKGEWIGVPDDSLVCYVKVQGPFLLTSAHLRKGYKQKTTDTGHMVFDAHTGNLLLWGF